MSKISIVSCVKISIVDKCFHCVKGHFSFECIDIIIVLHVLKYDYDYLKKIYVFI